MYCFFTDLDNTLIYSRDKIKKEKRCIEYKDGKEMSYMSEADYNRFSNLRTRLLVIPVTTRSLEQYQRISLFHQEVPTLALVANGGILLRNGRVDIEWLEETKRLVADASEELQKAKEILQGCEELSFEIRTVDDLFLFTKSSNPEKTKATLGAKLNPQLVTYCESHNKIYVLPQRLHKGLGVQRLRNTLSSEKIIAAGDSEFDMPLLYEGDIAIGLQEEWEVVDAKLLREKNHIEWNLWAGPKEEFCEFVLDTVEQIIK